jgi:hypothetical protein
MPRRQQQLLRTAFLFLFLLSVATVVTADAAAEAEATPAPEAGAADAGAATPEAAAEEPTLPPLDCKPGELLEKLDSWSIDCVAMWLEMCSRSTQGFKQEEVMGLCVRVRVRVHASVCWHNQTRVHSTVLAHANRVSVLGTGVARACVRRRVCVCFGQPKPTA